MNCRLVPLLDHGLKESVDLMNLGFSDYFLPIELNLPGFLHMIRVEGLDLGSSRVIFVDEEPAGVALIARRGWTSRLAAMCLAPAARRKGIGRAAMDSLLAEALGRGDHSMVLEVIEENVPGVRLYQSCGFKVRRRLYGYEATSPAGQALASLQPIDIREVARLVTIHGLEDLPWQVSGESLAQSGPPSAAWCLDQACLVTSNPVAEQVAIRSLIVSPGSRCQGQAARLVKAVLSAYPDRKWIVPALCPEEMGGFFERIGFQRGSLSQLQMKIDIQ